MSTPKDELFCRLALRQGYLNKEQAIELIRSYREESKVGQDIGAFALQAGWLQGPEVEQIEGAISHRAAGHVSSTKRRVPKTGGAATRTTHRRAARPEGRAASPAQLALVSIGAIVLLGCVLFLVFRFQDGNVITPSDAVSGKGAEEAAPKPEIKPAKEPEPESEKGPMVLSAEELENLTNRVSEAIMAARVGIERSPYRALERLSADRTRFGGDQIPKLLLDQITAQEQELRTAIQERYDELLADARKAQSDGKADTLKHILEDIADACGPEFQAKAEAALK